MKLFKRNCWRIKFDRNEFSGAFGDIGTTIPLIIGLCLTGKFDISRVFLVYGLMQIFVGLFYGIPMSVQPLKMVSMMVIAQKVPAEMVIPSGLVVGILMSLLALFGILNKMENLFPVSIIRGVQLGLGISLATTALKNYIIPSGTSGYILALICFIISIIFIGNRKYPPAFFLLTTGIIYSFITNKNYSPKISYYSAPLFFLPESAIELFNALFALVLPQFPLSVSNSILATKKLVNDLYPDIKIDIREIGFTYGLMNIISSFFYGIPVCHGAGGIAGHYNFGARTGGALIIAGILMITIGINRGFIYNITTLFPKPILGIILFFEAITLMTYIKDCFTENRDIEAVFITAIISTAIPYGYLIGITCGALFYYIKSKYFLFLNSKK